MQEIEHEAQIKKKKQQKQQQQQQKESGESKKEKGFLRKLFKKKQKETEEDGLTEEDLQWDESKKLELLAEFDIQPNEMSPWEGGRPTDIQLTAQLRIPKMGIVLTTEHTSLLVCSLEQLGVQVTKMKKYTQVYSCIEGLRVENGSQESEKWPYLVYTEQDALVDTNCVTRFLPEGLYTQERSLPFLQMAVELPSLQKDVDVTVKLQTLPLCVVANTACVMELAAFFIPELAKLNFAALSVSASSIYSQLSSSSKLRLKASKEVLSHKTLGLDVFMGALHMIIPEDIRQDVTHTQALVVRCGDLRVFSDPRRVSVDEELSEENIYDRIDVSVMRMSMLMTNQHRSPAEVRLVRGGQLRRAVPDRVEHLALDSAVRDDPASSEHEHDPYSTDEDEVHQPDSLSLLSARECLRDHRSQPRGLLRSHQGSQDPGEQHAGSGQSEGNRQHFGC